LLDRHADQIPELDALEVAAANGNILLARVGAELAGLLFFEQWRLSAILRYWVLAERYRNQGIGALLIEWFFRLSGESRRISLWVVADNRDAIEKYRHYGFERDRLVDQVMLMKKAS
jgi:GNAT superfamily N-acetyltransferase